MYTFTAAKRHKLDAYSGQHSTSTQDCPLITSIYSIGVMTYDSLSFPYSLLFILAGGCWGDETGVSYKATSLMTTFLQLWHGTAQGCFNGSVWFIRRQVHIISKLINTKYISVYVDKIWKLWISLTWNRAQECINYNWTLYISILESNSIGREETTKFINFIQ